MTEAEFYKDKQCFTIQVTDRGINVFDRKNRLQRSYEGTNIKSMIFSDDSYLYCIAGDMNDGIVKYDDAEDAGESMKEMNETSGFYVFDLSRLVKSEKLEIYKLRSAIGGVNTHLSMSQYNQRLSFVQDYNTISILPYCHRNTINFLGMSKRESYRIWREKGGFFTAMKKDGTIKTWSIATGKLVYRSEE